MKKYGKQAGLAALLAVSLLSAYPLSLQAAPKRPITEKDLLAFTWVADPQISPDGSRVVYVQVTIEPKEKKYVTSLWIVPTGGGEPRKLTTGTQDGSPRWSPDGRQLAFTRSTEKDNKPEPPQLYLLSMNGGEPQALTSIPKGVSLPVWSPDSRKLAFLSATNQKDLDEEKQKKDSKTEPEKESDVRVITEPLFRVNGQGYLDYSRRDHLWTVAVSTGADKAPDPQKLTDGAFDEADLFWAADSSRIYFTSDRRPDPEYLPGDSDLYSVSATGGAITKVASIDGYISNPGISPDGTQVAFIGTPSLKPERSYNEPELFVTGLQPGSTPRNLTAGYDYDIGSGPITDQHPPRGGGQEQVVWSADGKSIVVRSAERGRANLKRIDVATGKVTPLTDGDQEVVTFSGTPGATKLVALIANLSNIGDLFLVGSKQTTRLTRVNETLFSQLELGSVEQITYPSFDGKQIEAWVQKPLNFDPARKYPLILNIHGGPHAAYGYSFFHEMQWLAAKGYVVLYPNPRGSTSYGQDFANIIQYRYPGDDYKDLMAGVDVLIQRGYVDPERLGVTGGSGGGLLTNWTITQTDRFKAAVSQRSIADWTGFWYSADFTQFTGASFFNGAPWQNKQIFESHSPLTYIERVKTPLMLIEGEQDFRTPPITGGEQMFRALKYLKRPTAMVQFPGETHELSRSGKPEHRIERLQHIGNWFDKYLLGKPITTYDSPYKNSPATEAALTPGNSNPGQSQ